MTGPCWVCGSEASRPYLAGRLPAEEVDASHFRITDHDYGASARLWQCEACSFVFADPLPAENLVSMYEGLDDPEYVAGRSYRLLQMEALVRRVQQVVGPARTLLDVGAGTGMLVEAARQQGLEARGIEPSASLAEEARHHDLDVVTGVLPHPQVADTVDVVTCVDVIEHVSNPVALLRDLGAHTHDDGWIVVTTPDPESIARRVLGGRWWHFRLAHVCFFPRAAMAEAAARAGLRIVCQERQTWWFSLGYLAERVGALVGGARGARASRWLASVLPGRQLQVPLNLFDSWVVYLRPASGG